MPPRRRFNLLIDFNEPVPLSALQPFTDIGLQPSWLLLTHVVDGVAITVLYDNIDAGAADDLLANLKALPSVRKAELATIVAA